MQISFQGIDCMSEPVEEKRIVALIPFSELSYSAKVYIGLFDVVGVLFVCYGLWKSIPYALDFGNINHIGFLPLSVFFIVACLVLASFPIFRLFQGGTYYLSGAVTICAALILPPPLAVLVGSFSTIDRRIPGKDIKWHIFIFNRSLHAITYGGGAYIFQWLYGTGNISHSIAVSDVAFSLESAIMVVLMCLFQVAPLSLTFKLALQGSFIKTYIGNLKEGVGNYLLLGIMGIALSIFLSSHSLNGIVISTVLVVGLWQYRVQLGRAVFGEQAEKHRQELLILNHELEIAKTALAKQATTDALTGILNRRGFEELWNREIERSKRHEHRLSLLAIDLDKFKTVNDTYGHEMGDTILREVSKTLQSQIREIDIIGRIGGEEISVALPETGEQGALILAERLRASIESLKIEGYPQKCTISIGGASTENFTFERLIAEADRALYQAKKNGRNKVELAKPR